MEAIGVSDYTVMLHAHDATEDGPVFDATKRGETLHVDCACPRCGITPLEVGRFEGTLVKRERDEHRSVFCVACKKHVGTARYELHSIFGREADAEMMNNRWRVYGGTSEVQEGHGDVAASQFTKELRVAQGRKLS